MFKIKAEAIEMDCVHFWFPPTFQKLESKDIFKQAKLIFLFFIKIDQVIELFLY